MLNRFHVQFSNKNIPFSNYNFQLNLNILIFKFFQEQTVTVKKEKRFWILSLQSCFTVLYSSILHFKMIVVDLLTHTVKLGYNEVGYNERGYNELFYSEHPVIANKLKTLVCYRSF